MASFIRQPTAGKSATKTVLKDVNSSTVSANSRPTMGPTKPLAKGPQLYANVRAKVDTRRSSFSKVRLLQSSIPSKIFSYLVCCPLTSSPPCHLHIAPLVACSEHKCRLRRL